jgi:hypothetical protein
MENVEMPKMPNFIAKYVILYVVKKVIMKFIIIPKNISIVSMKNVEIIKMPYKIIKEYFLFK